VTIWYDVSDLMTWTLPHLTGIQRTTVGILNGLVAEGVPVRLTRFDRVQNRFEPLDAAHLPAGVRSHLALAPATCCSRSARRGRSPGMRRPPPRCVAAASASCGWSTT
jgi:hypothetical protein